MTAINFQKRFAGVVQAGRKTQTIRASVRYKVGAELQLYTGMRTKQCRKLADAICTKISTIRISKKGIEVHGYTQKWGTIGAELFAEHDGFKDSEEMLDWFDSTHGLPFNGYLIEWEIRK